MHQQAAVGLDLLKELQQLPRRVTAQPVGQLANRIVLAKQIPRPRQRRELIKQAQQIVAIGQRRMLAEIELMLIPRPLEPIRARAAPVRKRCLLFGRRRTAP